MAETISSSSPACSRGLDSAKRQVHGSRPPPLPFASSGLLFTLTGIPQEISLSPVHVVLQQSDARQDIPPGSPSTPSSRPMPEQAPFAWIASSTSTDDPEHLRKRVPLPSPKTRLTEPSSSTTFVCTTTFLDDFEPPRNTRFKGITPRRHPWTECKCCMSCSCVHHFRERSLHVPRLPCRRTVGTRNPGAPHHPCMTRSRPLLLHRYLRELPEPICCCGIIFGFVAVAPLSSTTVTNAS